jgi:O-antigen/teichoic acid export membrane protein
MKKLLHKMRANKEKLLVLTDQGVVSGVNFGVGVVLARFLGLEEYGLFALAWMIVMIVSSLHQAFVISSLFTLYPKSSNKEQYVSSLMALQVGFSIIAFVVIVPAVDVAFYMLPELERPYLIWTIPLVAVLYVFNDFLRRLFFTQHKPQRVLVMDCVGYGLQPVVVILLILTDALSISTTLMAICGTLGGSILVSLVFYYRGGISCDNLGSTFKKNWKFSRFLVGTALLQWCSGNLFIVVAAGVLGPIAVGAIRIAQNIMGVLHVLFLAMENIIPVRAAELIALSGKRSMLTYVGAIGKQTAIPLLLILASIAVFHKELIELLYGQQYVEYSGVLLAFCGLYVLVFIGTLLRFVIRTVENNKVVFYGYVLGMLFSVATAPVLINTWGLAGVMLGLFSVQVLTQVIYIISLRSELKWMFKSYT